MARLFSFRGEIEWDGQRGDAAFTYVPGFDIVASDLERDMVNLLNDGVISPDWFVYVTPVTEHESVLGLLKSELLSERFGNLKRCKGVALALFDNTGTFSEIVWIKSTDGGFVPPGLDQILFSVRSAGLAFLTEREGVITQAPPGAYFRNPSQCPRSYFIRATLLCRNGAEASFVAFGLLPLVAKAKTIYGKCPNIIWVDTISIAYIAYALSELGKRLCGFSSYPDIRSFSSYKGLRNTSPNIGDYPIFLISASTSGSMAKDLVSHSQNRIKPETISTILGAFDAPFPQLLYAIPESQRGRNIESVDTLREILVSGEDFLFNPGEPIAVVLKRLQLPKGFSKSFQKIQGKGLVHYFKRFSASKQPKAFFIEGSALAADDEFKHWLVSKARGALPATVRRIVYQNDEGSRLMAQIVQDAIAPFHRDNAPEILSIESIEEREAQSDETVAIVAAVVGSGMELMRIAKALRRYQPEGSRFFLIGAVLARSYMQLEQFKSNLRLANETLTYAVETWCEYAPAANAVHEYKSREADLFGAIAHVPEETLLGNFAVERLEILGSQGVVYKDAPKGEPFISLSHADSAFDVGKGFALWKEFKNNRCPIDVLFTVACWLQNARECRSLPNTERLDGGGFQQAIIAPDCFLRFTDSIIQASILRCAHDSELDYRSSLTVSARAAEIVSKFIRLHEESATEFLMALVLKRMRLRKSDKDRIVREAKIFSSIEHPLVVELAKRYEALDE